MLFRTFAVFRFAFKCIQFKAVSHTKTTNRGQFYGRPGGCAPFKSGLPVAPKCSVKWLHCAMFVLVTGLCLAFSDADIESDFALMTSAYSQYLRDSCKQHLALVGGCQYPVALAVQLAQVFCYAYCTLV